MRFLTAKTQNSELSNEIRGTPVFLDASKRNVDAGLRPYNWCDRYKTNPKQGTKTVAKERKTFYAETRTKIDSTPTEPNNLLSTTNANRVGRGAFETTVSTEKRLDLRRRWKRPAQKRTRRNVKHRKGDGKTADKTQRFARKGEQRQKTPTTKKRGANLRERVKRCFAR